MGSTCNMDSTRAAEKEISTLPTQLPHNSKLFIKVKDNHSIRFGDIEKIRAASLYEDNKYCFMMPIRNSPDIVKVTLPVVSSYTDQLKLQTGILWGEQCSLKGVTSEIFDTLHINSDVQTYHNFTVTQSQTKLSDELSIPQPSSSFSVKICPFSNYHDPAFKSALNQAALYSLISSYLNLPSPSPKEVFVLERGLPASMVFVHHLHLCTLFDVLQYRKLANLPYSRQEQNYLARQILLKYKVLRVNSIAHRDIRPSMIFLADPGTSSIKLGYEFMNLESARRYPPRSQGHQDLIQSVRGVPIYCSHKLREHQEKESQMASYNAFENDRSSLANLLICILTLQPYLSEEGHFDAGSKTKEMKKINEKLSKVIDKLHHQTEEEQSIENLMTLLPSSSTPMHAILESDHRIAQNILPELLRGTYKERMEHSRMEAMFSLHQRDQILAKLSGKVEENYQNQRYYENLEILDRMGRYYEGVGIPNNDYYREELNLLLELIEEERIKGFQTDEMLEKANTLHLQKLNKKKDTGSLASIRLAIENGYQSMQAGDNVKARNTVDEAFRSVGELNSVPIHFQLKLLEAKGTVQSRVGDEMLAGDLFEKGLELCGPQTNFTTRVERLEAKSTFEYLLAINTLQILKKDRSQMNGLPNSRLVASTMAKNVGRCEVLLESSKKQRIELPGGSPVKLGQVYEGLGDLALFKQNYQESARFYERTLSLCSNSQDYYVSDSLRIGFLEKAYRVYSNHFEDVSQQEVIGSKLKALKRKQQKQANQKGSEISKLKSLARDHRIRKQQYRAQGTIKQEEEYEEDQSDVSERSM